MKTSTATAELKVAPLDSWVVLRTQQQTLEAETKKIKGRIAEIAPLAQTAALAQLATANGVEATGLTTEELTVRLSTATVKTFDNQQSKITISFTSKLAETPELQRATAAFERAKAAVVQSNEAEIAVLLAEQEVLKKRIDAMSTTAEVSRLEAVKNDLQVAATKPVIKSLALKKA